MLAGQCVHKLFPSAAAVEGDQDEHSSMRFSSSLVRFSYKGLTCTYLRASMFRKKVRVNESRSVVAPAVSRCLVEARENRTPFHDDGQDVDGTLFEAVARPPKVLFSLVRGKFAG